MNQQNTKKRRPFLSYQTPSLVIGFCLLLVGTPGQTDDWVTYRSDVARSGVGSETVGSELSLRWTRIPTHRPVPAWPMPAEEIPRMHVDNALHVAVADGRVYFGSPVTGRVYAVDAATGKTAWTFTTEGPVRFAPTYDAGRIYLGSDDGNVYCLDARDGSVVWKYRPGPRNEKVIGNGHPLRCSVALVHKPSKAMGNWSVFVSSGAMTPVTHLALDLGAPGDVRDDNGLLWFAYPRIRKTLSVYNANPNYGIQLDIHEKFLPGGGFFCADTKRLFASGGRGLLRCELPLIDQGAGQESATYTVRLGLSNSSSELPRQRDFDIKLQGQLVARDRDARDRDGTKTAGEGEGRVVMEFKSVPVTENLVIELVPKSETPDLDQAPIVNFIEVIRDDAVNRTFR